jgi:hypothetical protein
LGFFVSFRHILIKRKLDAHALDETPLWSRNVTIQVISPFV